MKLGWTRHVWMPLRIVCSVFTCDVLLIPSRHLPLTFDPDLAFWLTRGKKAQRQESCSFSILYTALLYICHRCVPFLLRFTFLFHFRNNLKPLKFQNHSYMIRVLKRKIQNLRFVWLHRNNINICHPLNIDATSAWRNGALDSSWSCDVLTWRKCCRCAKGLVQREVTQGLEILLLSALSEVLTSSATGWWSGWRMICLLLWAQRECAVINYNVQHPVTDSSDSHFFKEEKAAMQVEERSATLQESPTSINSHQPSPIWPLFFF